MKKMLSVALAAALVLGIAGCGGAGTPETAATEAATTATEAAKESETAAAGSTEAAKAPEQSAGGKKAAMITAQPLGDKGVTLSLIHILRLSAADYLIKSPVAHTAEGWMTFGFHEDLTVAAYEALQNMRLLLKRAFDMEETDAMTFCSVGADLRVTQIVNAVSYTHLDVYKRQGHSISENEFPGRGVRT